MATGYSKLDCGIVDSSLWEQPHDVLRVWIAMLAKTDASGYVRVAAPAMARLCHLDRERFNEIIEQFCSPDPESRSTEHEGRRLQRVDGGWLILNYSKYREGLKQPDSSAGRMRKLREKKKCDGSAVTVTVGDAYAEAEAEAEAEAKEDRIDYDPPAASQTGGAHDPLAKLPRLQRGFDRINQGILKNHPKAVIPKKGSKQELESKQVLERLVRLDGYTEDQVCATLYWVLHEEPDSPTFTWREQFRSIAQLREVKAGASKFTKMHQAMLRASKVFEEPDDPMVVAARKERARQQAAAVL